MSNDACKSIAAAQGYVYLEDIKANNQNKILNVSNIVIPKPNYLYKSFNELVNKNNQNVNAFVKNDFCQYQIELDKHPNSIWEDKDNRPEIKIRESIDKKLMEEIDEVSRCPDRYNIPRDIKASKLIPYNEWIQIGKPIREYLGYVNYRYVPSKYLKDSYQLPLDYSCFKIAHDPKVGLGVYLNIPNFNNKILPKDTKLGYYYGVYLTDKEVDKIYKNNIQDDEGLYIFQMNVEVEIDDGEFLFKGGTKIKNIVFIDSGKYGSIMSRVNYGCPSCSNCIAKTEYIPISLDTYLW